jgi:hypothetical protein
MKTIKLLIVFISIIAFFSCRKNGNSQTNAEQYIKLLKSNKYESPGFPAFTFEDIDQLIKYRNEKDLIIKYPRNPISSYAQEECKLGIYVLWTIEAIRTGSINSTSWMGSFPSQNPVLQLRDFSAGLVFVDDDEAHRTVSNAYYTWWNSRLTSSVSFTVFMQTDPLKDTKYAWH